VKKNQKMELLKERYQNKADIPESKKIIYDILILCDEEWKKCVYEKQGRNEIMCVKY
jgi:hypothetical protein